MALSELGLVHVGPQKSQILLGMTPVPLGSPVSEIERGGCTLVLAHKRGREREMDSVYVPHQGARIRAVCLVGLQSARLGGTLQVEEVGLKSRGDPWGRLSNIVALL